MKILQEVKPDLIICTDPSAVHTAYHYRKSQNRELRIVYDVTEWYPSKKDLSRHTLPVRILLFPGYIFDNLLAGARAGAFIFGEWYKSRPFRIFFPRKEHIYVGYYPSLDYIPYTKPVPPEKVLHLSYSGKLSREKGFGHFLEVVERLGQKRSMPEIRLRIIGWYEEGKEKKIYEKRLSALKKHIRVEMHPFTDFRTFLRLISDTDIFLDLRATDPENQRCLPIKLFYAAAFGRPVIYSDLMAIRKEVEIDRFGFLTDPADRDRVVSLLEKYIDDPELYLHHCRNARELAEKKYNWEAIKEEFISFCNKTAGT
jgi:glycosyltransferase involved in cell wall biosynthesis